MDASSLENSAPSRSWTILLESVPLAGGFRVLLLAFLGIFSAQFLGLALDRTVGLPIQIWNPPELKPNGSLEALGLHRPWNDASGVLERRELPGVRDYLATAFEPLSVVARPFAFAFSPAAWPSERVKSLLFGFALMFSWGTFGGAIARVVLAQFCLDRRLGLVPAIERSARTSRSIAAAVLAPIVLTLVLSIPALVVGLISRIPYVGPLLGVFLGIIPLLAAIPVAFILIGTALAWPSMVLTVALDEDAFETVSRSFSYVNRRQVVYLGLLALGFIAGGLSLFAVRMIAEVVGQLVRTWFVEGVGEAGPAVMLLPLAWAYAFFWTWFTLAYLILRREIDGVPLRAMNFRPASSAAETAPEFAAVDVEGTSAPNPG